MEAKVVRLAQKPRLEAHPLSARTGTLLPGLVLALLFTMVLGITCGAVRVPFHGIVSSLLHARALSPDDRVILMEIRLPRVLAAALVGAALSAAGLLFQGLFRNPLADPYVIGSSGGAVLGATIAMMLLPQVTWLVSALSPCWLLPVLSRRSPSFTAWRESEAQPRRSRYCSLVLR